VVPLGVEVLMSLCEFDCSVIWNHILYTDNSPEVTFSLLDQVTYMYLDLHNNSYSLVCIITCTCMYVPCTCVFPSCVLNDACKCKVCICSILPLKIFLFFPGFSIAEYCH